MYKASAKGVEIAAKLNHSKTIVYIDIKRFESCGTLEGEKLISLSQKISEHSCRVVKCALIAHQTQTLANITNQFGFDVSHWTVRKALNETGFYNRVAQKKPFLNHAHKGKRFEFALERQKWTSEGVEESNLDK